MGLRLIGEVALDGSGFEAGLKKLEHGAERVGETLKGLAMASFGIYGIENAISKTIETAEKLANTAERLGISLDALQEFRFAARQTGTDIETLTTFIEKLNSTRIDPKNLPFYKALGISQPMVGDVTDLIMRLNANIRGRSPQEVIGPLKKIGGKGNIPGEMMNMLSENLDELRQKAHEFGVVMESEDIIALKMLKDELEIVSEVLIAQFAPALVRTVESLLKAAARLDSAGEFWVRMKESSGGSWTQMAARWLQQQNAAALLRADAKNPFLTPEQRKAAHEVNDTWQNDLAEAVGGMMQIDEDWKKKLSDLDAEIKRRADELRNPRKPDFESVMGEEKEPRGAKRQIYSDSLLAVGGFLGSASNPMVSIGHTHTKLLTRIAEHTSRIGKKESSGHPPH